jgi:crossover junction endodeoxyribonuclease ruvC
MIVIFLIIGLNLKTKKDSMKERLIIGIDPGLANTGYGILSFSGNRFKMLSCGVITTEASSLHGYRLLHIYNELTSLLKEYRPTEAGIETLYFAKNVTSALSVSEARGVVILALFSEHVVDVGEYTPNTIKKAVTGIAQATKDQVQEATRILLGLEKKPKPNHAADALAAAIAKANIGTDYV